MSRFMIVALAFTFVPVAAHAGNRIKVATAEAIARKEIRAQMGQRGVGLTYLGTRGNVRKMSWAGSLNNNGQQPYMWGSIKIDMRKNQGDPKGAARIVSFRPGIQDYAKW